MMEQDEINKEMNAKADSPRWDTGREEADEYRNEGDLRSLNLSDNYLFAKVMEDTRLCQRVLEEILQIPIRKVKLVHTEKALRNLPDSKGIRMDVYVEDKAGSIYNVEMQTGQNDDLPKRARYYQGTIDLDQLPAGSAYAKLKKTFVIFICTFPLFDKERHIYTFVNICEENTTLRLGDETVKIFLSTCGKMNDISRDLQEFLKYLEHSTEDVADRSGSPLVQAVHHRVQAVKDTERYRVEYMDLYMYEKEIERKATERGLAKGLQQGLQQGLAEGRAEGQSIKEREDIALMADYLQRVNPNISREEALEVASSALKPKAEAK